MTKYILAYHGGGMPATPAEGAKMMEDWNNWYGAIADKLADGGSAFGKSMTVNSNGSVSQGGGANPLSGYTVVNADSYDAACVIAKGSPILGAGGTIEVCEFMDM